MRKYLFATMASVTLVGFVSAEEFMLHITGIAEDGSLTGKKMPSPFTRKELGEGPSFKLLEKITLKVAKDVKVHKGKLDNKAHRFVADGEDLKLAGLRIAVQQAQNGDVLVAGKRLSQDDLLEIKVRDGKPSAKLNGKDIPFADVIVRGPAVVTTYVTTTDDGAATSILILEASVGKEKAKPKIDK